MIKQVYSSSVMRQCDGRYPCILCREERRRHADEMNSGRSGGRDKKAGEKG